ncbi:MAG: hypothetical protein HC853_05805 [Anaerolineae bacterium]|nr:hypothetical protein [Anaerolineae bacterium]
MFGNTRLPQRSRKQLFGVFGIIFQRVRIILKMKSNRPPRSRAFTIISILIVTMIILSMLASAISLVQ